MFPPPGSRGPDPEGPTPDPKGPTPDPEGPAPDPEGPTPDPEGPTPAAQRKHSPHWSTLVLASCCVSGVSGGHGTHSVAPSSGW